MKILWRRFSNQGFRLKPVHWKFLLGAPYSKSNEKQSHKLAERILAKHIAANTFGVNALNMEFGDCKEKTRLQSEESRGILKSHPKFLSNAFLEVSGRLGEKDFWLRNLFSNQVHLRAVLVHTGWSRFMNWRRRGARYQDQALKGPLFLENAGSILKVLPKILFKGFAFWRTVALGVGLTLVTLEGGWVF